MSKELDSDIYKIAALPRDAKRLRKAGLSCLSTDMAWILKDGKLVDLWALTVRKNHALEKLKMLGYQVVYTWSVTMMLKILEYPVVEKMPKNGWQCRVSVETRDENGKFCIKHEGESGPTVAEAMVNMLLRLLKENHINSKYVSKI